jgi:hypothetical protein
MADAAPKKRLKPRPVVMVWTGEHMVPLPRFKRLCDQQFEVNGEYPLTISEHRSMASHNFFFAWLGEAFDNLAEEYAQEFPTVEHMRAWALVQAGYATESNFVLDTAKDARQMAIALRKTSPLAVIKVSGNVVKHFEAESQSTAAMGKERFEASKSKVIEIVAAMARTTPAELKKNAGRSA